MINQHKSKVTRLFIILSVIFITNAIIAEFIGVKIFSLEKTLGFSLLSLNLFGINKLSFQLTAGVLIWPVVFVLTDVINEYFGKKGVLRLSYLAVVMIAYSFIVIFIAIHLVPADFWPTSHIDFLEDPSKKQALSQEVANYNSAFSLVFGQGLRIIMASIIAFLIGQILDAFIFYRLKLWTDDKGIWLRATGSTLVSQFFDSYIVLFIAFYFGANWPISQVLAIGTVNYIYKICMAIGLTPIIYLIHFLIRQYLGKDLSDNLKHEALQN
ncbi:MAG: queuosine precursor transporter [Saprospiraceae bacterium]|nr:queuosine precursor transporter [Saprospiraceae bacterium]